MDVALWIGVLVLVVGFGFWLWGRRQQAAARAQLGQRGGFGGPPGTTDIGTEIGFGVDGPGPDPNAGRTTILVGQVLTGLGVVLAVVALLVRLMG